MFYFVINDLNNSTNLRKQEFGKMTYLAISTYIVKPEKQGDFMRFWKSYLNYMKKNPEMFKEVKSLKLYTQMFGGISGAYVELLEFESLTDQETLEKKLVKNEEAKKLLQEFIMFRDSSTHTTNLLKSVT
ncbi:MAG TPA: hypothetical protein VEC97_02850 [Candidatus Acidoferrales bacterium]|nr:hypothetical protein [Candidatus Acidoferrales bacterium]